MIILPPAPLPLRNIRWRCPEPAQVNRSAWTGRSKVIGLPGIATWQMEATFVAQIGVAQGRPWRAFFMALRGQLNMFRVRGVEAVQTAAANAAVRSGGDADTTLPLEGLPANATVLRAGDLMTVTLPSGHERMVCLIAPLVSNGQGQGTATFAPELGEVPIAGSTVEIREPWSLMRLSSEPPGWDVDAGQIYRFQVQAEEAL